MDQVIEVPRAAIWNDLGQIENILLLSQDSIDNDIGYLILMARQKMKECWFKENL